MYLQILAQRARVPLRRQRDGCVALHFPPILPRCSGAAVLPPGSTLNFSMLFLKHDNMQFSTKTSLIIVQRFKGAPFRKQEEQISCTEEVFLLNMGLWMGDPYSVSLSHPRSSGPSATRNFPQTVGDPLRFWTKAHTPIKFSHPFITKDHVEPDTGIQFVQTNRAKELRAGIALLKMVGPVHDAVKIDAMGQGKHMARLVNHNFTASFQ
jgi:hypothetical protein